MPTFGWLITGRPKKPPEYARIRDGECSLLHLVGFHFFERAPLRQIIQVR